MEQPGKTYLIGNGYRYSINGQERTPEIAPNTTTAEFWQYDARIAKRWNLDPRPNTTISPYSSFAGNPIVNADTNGDTLSIGTGQRTRDDIITQVSPQNQGFVNLPAPGRDDVTINKSITIGNRIVSLREAMNNDKGLANLVDLVDDTHNYFYNATYKRNVTAIDLDPHRGLPPQVLTSDITADPVFAVGNPVPAVMAAGGGSNFYRTFENNSFTLRGDEATELNNFQIVPNKTLAIGYVNKPYTRSYDGTVRIAPGEFQQHIVTATGTQINLVRANIVYHELRENYYRVNGSSYRVAHEQAMLDYAGVRVGLVQNISAAINNTSRISDAVMLKSAANLTTNSSLIYIRR